MSVQFIGDSGQAYIIEKRLAEGGQGYIYLVKGVSGSSGDNVVKWYKGRLANDSQRQQLVALIKQGVPRTEVDGVQFIWPLEMVRISGQEGYGYVMPMYDTSTYVHLNKVINGKRKQPSLDVLCRVSYRMCMAMEAVHRDGMAYCDVNLGNIHFDFDMGRIVVCDNDNVVVNNADVQVLGVPEFMAPEVALDLAKPNAQTDLYSMAILLYQLWTWEHPMEGRLAAQVKCWDLPAKRKFYAKEPLFVHHPTDRRNSVEGDPILALSLKRWDCLCPTAFKSKLIQTFTEGIQHPEKRTRLSEWQRLFMEMEENETACIHCGARNLVDIAVASQQCFHCQKQLPVRLVMSIQFPGGSSHLVVKEGARLRRHHLEAGTQMDKLLEVVGGIEQHPKTPKAHILRNNDLQTWYYDVGEDKFRIEPGQARALLEGGKVCIGAAQAVIKKL